MRDWFVRNLNKKCNLDAGFSLKGI